MLNQPMSTNVIVNHLKPEHCPFSSVTLCYISHTASYSGFINYYFDCFRFAKPFGTIMYVAV